MSFVGALQAMSQHDADVQQLVSRNAGKLAGIIEALKDGSCD